MSKPLRILSLGAGVQSTTLALMSACGKLDRLDHAIFADTGWEPAAVYRHLDWLERQLPFPVHRVSAGNLRDDLVAGFSRRTQRFITVPFFLLHKNGATGLGRRQCTSHYKVEPIARKTRELLGVGPRDRIAANSVEKWLGISLDEAIRATPSKLRYETKRFPLLELRLGRRECLKWLAERQFPTPPKSACIGCPFHDDNAWRALRDNTPDEWADAIALDRLIRRPQRPERSDRFRAEQFMHRSCKPLDQVDLSTAEDRGQLNLFQHECQGLCGV